MNALLTSTERAAIKMAAVEAKQRPSKWTDEQLIAFRDHGTVPGAPAAPAAPAAAKAPAKQRGALEQAIADVIREELGDIDTMLNEQRVIDLIKQHGGGESLITIQIADKAKAEVREIEGAHSIVPRVLRHVSVGNPVFLVGPAGGGKTTICEQVAVALGVPFRSQQAVKQKHDLLGFVDGHGVYHRTEFRDAYEFGGVFNADEIDSWGADATIALNSATANGFCTFPDGQVRRHADFVFIAAGNTYGKGADRVYVGRNPLDGATLNRFAVVTVDYDEALETALGRAHFEAHGGTDMAVVDGWIAFVRQVRAAVSKAKVRHIVSPRAVIMGAKLLAVGAPMAEAAEDVLWQGLGEDIRAQLGFAA